MFSVPEFTLSLDGTRPGACKAHHFTLAGIGFKKKLFKTRQPGTHPGLQKR